MKYFLINDLIRPQLYYFHALHERDLPLIAEVMEKRDLQGYLVAISVGITKIKAIIFKFGEIVFLGDKQLVQDMRIYERDIWSPTLSDVPKVLFAFEPKGLAHQIFAISPYLEGKIKEFASLDLSDPKRQVSLMIDNDSEVYHNLLRIVEKNPELSRKYVNKDYPTEIDMSAFTSDLVEDIFQLLPHKRKNIVQWLKRAFKKEIRGTASFASAYAIASPLVPFEELEEKANQKLLTEQSLGSFEKIKEQQNLILNELSLFPQFRTRVMDWDTIAGDLLKHGSYEGFKKELREYGIKTQEYSRSQLHALYTKLNEAIVNVSSEYFEAKTLEAVPINAFKQVVIEDAIFDRVQIFLQKKLGFTGEYIRKSQFITQFDMQKRSKE